MLPGCYQELPGVTRCVTRGPAASYVCGSVTPAVVHFHSNSNWLIKYDSYLVTPCSVVHCPPDTLSLIRQVTLRVDYECQCYDIRVRVCVCYGICRMFVDPSYKKCWMLIATILSI